VAPYTAHPKGRHHQRDEPVVVHEARVLEDSPRERQDLGGSADVRHGEQRGGHPMSLWEPAWRFLK